MSDEIKIGDVVRLRSGGPPMTVIRSDEPDKQDGPDVVVQWFDRGDVRASVLNRRALVLDAAIEQATAVMDRDVREHQARPWLEWAAEQLEASVRRLDAESIRTGARLDGAVDRIRALEQRAPAAPEAGCGAADLFSIRSRLEANEERFRALAEERVLPLEAGASEIRTQVDVLSLASESRDDQESKHQAEIERAHVRIDAVAERIDRAENIIGLTAGLLIPLVQEIRTRPATDRQTGARLKDLEQALMSAIAAKDGGSR